MIEVKRSAQALGLAALVAPSVFAQNSVTLAWDPANDGPVPEGYKIYASPISGQYQNPPIGETTNLTFKTATLPLGRWHFVATAYIGELESEYSNEASTITLGAPKNLRLETGTNYMHPMRLVWDKSASSIVFGDVKYRLYRRNKNPSTAEWFHVTETFNTFYSAQVLQAGDFVYRVATIKGGFTSENSSNDLFIHVGLAAKEQP